MIWQGDTENMSPGYSSRGAMYGVGGIPHAQFQGTIADVGGGSAYSRYVNHYNGIIDTDSPISIDLTLDFNSNGELLVQGSVSLEADLTTTSNKIVFILSRNISSDYFCSVAGYHTEDFDLTSVGETEEFSHAFSLDETWNLGDLKGIIMIQSWSSKYIIQAASTGFTGLVPLFSSNVTSGPPALGVQFTDFSMPAEGIDSWEWDFDGDGSIDSTEQNPYHLYEEEGVYDVFLRITDDGETQEILKEDYIHVNSDDVISGKVSGIWKQEHNPYVIDGDAIVESDDLLIIEEGAEIITNNGSQILVNGTLQAIGSPENPIFFSSDSNWSGINFNYSEMENKIHNCKISKAIESAINVNFSSVEIVGNAIFENNSSMNGAAINLSSSDNVLIKQNFITNNESNTATGGISCSGSSPVIANNIIVNNTANPALPASAAAIILKNGSNASIVNNTIANNEATNAFFIVSSEPVIDNSIVSHNGAILYEIASITMVNYSCISGNFIGVGNIDEEPLFDSPTDGDGLDFDGFSGSWYLQSTSPCIDAGNPNETYNDVEDPNNPGYALWPAMGTLTNDIGAFGGEGFPIEQFVALDITEINSIKKIQTKIYPNPFNPNTTISFELPNESFVSIDIYNVKGQHIKKLLNTSLSAGSHQVSWDGRSDGDHSVSSGIYFSRITSHQNNLSSIDKLILMK